MTPLSDRDLQALLSGDLDPRDVSDRMEPTTQTDLDAYRKVWAALETPPAAFAPGFADRVTAAVEADRARVPAKPRAYSFQLASILAAVVLLVFRAPLATTFSGAEVAGALPWIAAALLAIACTDLVDRALRRVDVV